MSLDGFRRVVDNMPRCLSVVAPCEFFKAEGYACDTCQNSAERQAAAAKEAAINNALSLLKSFGYTVIKGEPHGD